MSIAKKLLMGAAGVSGEKTYVDDVFSTYVWIGNSSARSINTGIDMTEGGTVWIKQRNSSETWALYDTARGATKRLKSSSTDVQETLSNGLTGFTATGFTHGNDNTGNDNGSTYLSWNFRKQKGFFDCIKFTGSGGTSSSPQSISHSLGSIPGMIIIKNLTQASQWFVYHVSTGVDKFLQFNKTDAAVGYNGGFKNITSSSIDVFDSNSTNTNEFIAYVFAGGESTAATARSVNFDGSNDYLNLAASTDFDFGTGDFTIEFWMNPEGNDDGTISLGNYSVPGGFELYYSNNMLGWYFDDGTNSAYRIENIKINKSQWTHVALVRSGNTVTLYTNGINGGNTYDATGKSVGHNGNNTFRIGCSADTSPGNFFDGKISNVRVVKGTAVYTSSFRPPTEPLKNITNTKLLCCNNASVTGATIAPGTITNSGSTASTDSPFDDPKAFKFGESREGVVKMGSYIGNGSSSNAAGVEVVLGWEPQWVMLKGTGQADNWWVVDCIRGIVTDGNPKRISTNLNNPESGNYPMLEATSTGFRVVSGALDMNVNNGAYIFTAIRRSDGYVGKPAEVGTDSFAMDTGNSSSTIPAFDSNIVIDMFLHQQPASSGLDWRLTTRFNAPDKLAPNTTAAESDESPNNEMDSNVGIGRNYTNVWQAWMWKRGQGFDVVAYQGNQTSGRDIAHSLSKTPEMIWIKNRNNASNSWVVGHKGLHGGTDPWDYSMVLNDTLVEADNVNKWNDTAPTSTHFRLGNSSWLNYSDDWEYLAMLFASVDGISKVGYYTGSGSTGFSVTTGFSPRFIIIKRVDSADYWAVFDTLRGLGSGNDPMLKLNSNAAEITGYDIIDPTSTGFDIVSTDGALNGSGGKYIYYAHA